MFQHTLLSRVKKKFHPYFLYNNFQNPIVIKWIQPIDYLLECFIRIVAIMVDILWLSPERKLMDAPFTNEEHLYHRIVHVTVI